MKSASDNKLLQTALKRGLVREEDWMRVVRMRVDSTAGVGDLLVSSGLLSRETVDSLRTELRGRPEASPRARSGRSRSTGGSSRRPSPRARSARSDKPPGRSERPTHRRKSPPTEPGRPPWPLKPGQKLGHYTIKKCIGKGGMGLVFQVRHEKLKKDYALKVLPPDKAEDEALLARFQHESRAGAKLRHPNIVAVHDVGVVRGLHYFTMDLIEGPSLRKLINEGSLKLRETLDMFSRLALALHHAHGQSIIHRDLKPSNILISHAGEPFLMDFGLAKQLTGDTDLTRLGKTVGTLAYMSPEQGMGKRELIGPCSDIFSLGVTLYEALTGRLPISAKSTADFVKMLLEGRPPTPKQIRPDLPDGVSDLVLSCIQREISRRPADCLELHNGLRECIRELSSPRASQRSQPASERARSERGSSGSSRQVNLRTGGDKGVVLWAVLLVVLFVLGGVAGAALRPWIWPGGEQVQQRLVEAADFERAGEPAKALDVYSALLIRNPAYLGYRRLAPGFASKVLDGLVPELNPALRKRFVYAVADSGGVWLTLSEVQNADYLEFVNEMDCGAGAQLRYVPRRPAEGGYAPLWTKNGEAWSFNVDGSLPVAGVSRQDAEAYCAWLGRRDGCQYRVAEAAECKVFTTSSGFPSDATAPGTRGFRLVYLGG